MKNLFILLFASVLLLSSCADSKVLNINGEEKLIEPYGWVNMENRNPNVKYQVSMGNVVWSIILCETIMAPVIFTGWYLWEPVDTISVQ
jgi:hypothetical protein